MVTKKNKESEGKKPSPNNKRAKQSQAVGFSNAEPSVLHAEARIMKLDFVRRHQKRIENQEDLIQTGHRIIAAPDPASQVLYPGGGDGLDRVRFRRVGQDGNHHIRASNGSIVAPMDFHPGSP